jgi:hypothetical protein
LGKKKFAHQLSEQNEFDKSDFTKSANEYLIKITQFGHFNKEQIIIFYTKRLTFFFSSQPF